MENKRKKIDGKIFYLYKKTEYKDRANSIATKLRKKGYRARIIKVNAPQGYRIYVNQVIEPGTEYE